jgi:hypothetical protein
LPADHFDREIPEETLRTRRLLRWLLRYVCPIAILAMLVAAMT